MTDASSIPSLNSLGQASKPKTTKKRKTVPFQPMREYMKANNLNEEAIGEFIGVSPTAVFQWKGAEQMPIYAQRCLELMKRRQGQSSSGAMFLITVPADKADLFNSMTVLLGLKVKKIDPLA